MGATETLSTAVLFVRDPGEDMERDFIKCCNKIITTDVKGFNIVLEH